MKLRQTSRCEEDRRENDEKKKADKDRGGLSIEGILGEMGWRSHWSRQKCSNYKPHEELSVDGGWERESMEGKREETVQRRSGMMEDEGWL